MEEMSEEVFHSEVFFTGRVQGVGFRWKTQQIARQFEVSGYVLNMDDGRVHLEAEGSENEVNAFVSEVKKQMDVFIRNVEEKTQRRPRQFSGFDISK